MEIDVAQLAALFQSHGVKVKDCGRYLLLETSEGSVEMLNEVSYPFTPKVESPKPIDSHAETRRLIKTAEETSADKKWSPENGC
ncbi:MAG: hypothetical protein Q7S83_01140 [bacterium]|nr:hypothetical protein [bacterium]